MNGAEEHVPPVIAGELRTFTTGVRLTVDQRAALGVMAPMLLRSAEGANNLAERTAKMMPGGFYQGLALTATNALALLAASVATIGASVAWALCNDGGDDDTATPTPPAAPATNVPAEAQGEG